MGRMAQLSEARPVRALVRLGWEQDRQSGSHAVLPPRQAGSAWGAAHWTPHAPQFLRSSASTTSQSLAGSLSQSAVPGKQVRRRLGPSMSGGSSAALLATSTGETVSGIFGVQLPKTKRRLAASDGTPKRAIWVTPSLTPELSRSLGAERPNDYWRVGHGSRCSLRGVGRKIFVHAIDLNHLSHALA